MSHGESLASDEVHVWLLHPEAVPPSDDARLQPLLAAEELARWRRFVNTPVSLCHPPRRGNPSAMHNLRQPRPTRNLTRRPADGWRAPTALSAAFFRGLKLSLFLDCSAGSGGEGSRQYRQEIGYRG